MLNNNIALEKQNFTFQVDWTLPTCLGLLRESRDVFWNVQSKHGEMHIQTPRHYSATGTCHVSPVGKTALPGVPKWRPAQRREAVIGLHGTRRCEWKRPLQAGSVRCVAVRRKPENLSCNMIVQIRPHLNNSNTFQAAQNTNFTKRQSETKSVYCLWQLQWPFAHLLANW